MIKKKKKIQSKVRLRVKQLRLENNKTQDDIAKYLGVDKSTYNKYENGKRKFNNDVVKALANYYDIKVSDIVDKKSNRSDVKKWAYHTYEYSSLLSLI